MNETYSPPGVTTLLVGDSGTGKTHAIRTLIEAGVTPFIIFTEPGLRTISDITCEHLHYKYIPPAKPTWDVLTDSANKINTMSFEALSKQKDINKSKYRQFIEVSTSMNDFVCDRCGEHFGDVATWQTDRAIVIDSLTGLSTMAMDLTVGSKPTKMPGDWGVAMDNLERFINAMCSLTQCHFVLTSHLTREKDEITGGMTLMASTLGQKLAPKLPSFFDDVIMCQRNGKEFVWSTAAVNVSLKARNLPIADNLIPSFVQIINSWKEAGGKILLTQPKEEPTPAT